MSKLYKRFSRLVLRFDDIKSVNGVDKHSYHLNYENGRYREGELVSLVRGALPHFALTPEEFRKLKEDDDVDEMYRLAFSRISKAKKDKKGDYGELLLFLILMTFYGNNRLVTKVRLRSSVKDQIKGFDCAHFVVNDLGSISLWLGEVKFYKDFSSAVSDVVKEIHEHTQEEYLKNEFSILCPNIEHNKDIELPEEIIEYLDGSIPLSDVDIVIPALVTYETKLIDKFGTVCDGFREAFKRHFEEKFGILDGKEIIVPPNIKVFFILLPLKDLNSIKERLEQFEGVFRNESL